MTQHVTNKTDEKLQLKADILLIEDEPLVSALIKRYLGSIKSDYRIISLESGFDLLHSDLSGIKVAIVDILLPQVTGVDLIRDFRKRFPQMGILAVSGMATDHMKRQLQELLPDELKFLPKPLRKENFCNAFAGAWKFNEKSKLYFEQQRLTSPIPAKEGEEELWTAVKVSEKAKASVAVERRVLSPKKVAA